VLVEILLFTRLDIDMTLITLIKIIWAVSAAGLIVLVLLHSPKGDGLGALGGQAQLFTSTKSAEITLNRATWTLTVLFMGLTIILSGGWLNAPAG
jgi:preprotein translocase subunit SecG